MPVAVAAAVVGAAATIYTGNKARGEQRRAQAIENRRRRNQARRDALLSAEEALMQRQGIIQAGENQGVSGSSTVAGGTAAIQSGLGGALGFAEQNNQFLTAANQRMARASEWLALGESVNAITSAVSSGMTNKKMLDQNS